MNDYIPFEGWNCFDLEDNYCSGWDQESRRCDCGNRRVYWEELEDGTKVAVAY